MIFTQSSVPRSDLGTVRHTRNTIRLKPTPFDALARIHLEFIFGKQTMASGETRPGFDAIVNSVTHTSRDFDRPVSPVWPSQRNLSDL